MRIHAIAECGNRAFSPFSHIAERSPLDLYISCSAAVSTPVPDSLDYFSSYRKHDDNDEKTAPPRQCASYTKRVNKPVSKSIAKRPQNANYTDAQRLQALTLYEHGIVAKIAATVADVKDPRAIKWWLCKTQKQNYDRTKSTIINIKYVQNAYRSNRSIRRGSAQEIATSKDLRRNLITSGRLE